MQIRYNDSIIDIAILYIYLYQYILIIVQGRIQCCVPAIYDTVASSAIPLLFPVHSKVKQGIRQTRPYPLDWKTGRTLENRQQSIYGIIHINTLKNIRKFNFSILSSLYANLTRVVKERKASLLGLHVGSQPVLVSCQQHLVQLSSLKSYSRTTPCDGQ